MTTTREAELERKLAQAKKLIGALSRARNVDTPVVNTWTVDQFQGWLTAAIRRWIAYRCRHHDPGWPGDGWLVSLVMFLQVEWRARVKDSG